MNALLLSATGFFPLYVDPLLCLLSSMVKTKDDAIQVFNTTEILRQFCSLKYSKGNL